jgi:hypothetical protein
MAWQAATANVDARDAHAVVSQWERWVTPTPPHNTPEPRDRAAGVHFHTP